ncbi:hypothetical protein GGI20_003953 [Coemansia sp. BCRC 34301]|nr:hypothetical protein GGI20_003953 [Coemansia sp. BCRC 34301]
MLRDTSHSGGEQTAANSGSNNPAPKTPVKSAHSVNVSAASHHSTPQGRLRIGVFHEHPFLLSEQRKVLSNAFKAPLEDLGFESLVIKLCLKCAFAEYKAASKDLFTHIMDSIPIPVCPAENAKGVNVGHFLEPFDSKPDAYRSYAPQMADYVMALREFQPTRTFVSMLFLNGCYLELLIFVHSGYYRAHIGQVLHEDNDEDVVESVSPIIANSLQRLWFLLTLPVDKFGFLFGSTKTNIIVRKPISRPVRITGRCTYLFNAEYNRKEAILKFSWMPTNRLPEGAVYEAFVRGGVSNMPQIYASGILIRGLFSYRLEFLVMEHCGTPIVEYIQSKPRDYTRYPQVTAEAALYVEQVARTLTEALENGILHRDISAGNIAIKDGKAYVIDWGFAKLLQRPGDNEYATDIATRWSFNWDTVIKIESAKDPITGTLLYMSCRLLLEAKKRSIYDNFESLLYVILDTFPNRQQASGMDE